jgi:ParB family transcriptional regulator, chromosome partitioning protein
MKLALTQTSMNEIFLPSNILKLHTPRQLEQLQASIKQFGFNDPIAVDENNVIVEGVGRYLAAKALKLKTVPAIRLSHLTESQKKAYRIAHNKLCFNTGFDLAALRQEFESLSDLPEALLDAMGFEPIELRDLLAAPVLPELAPELGAYLEACGQSVTCPNCGEKVYV